MKKTLIYKSFNKLNQQDIEKSIMEEKDCLE